MLWPKRYGASLAPKSKKAQCVHFCQILSSLLEEIGEENSRWHKSHGNWYSQCSFYLGKNCLNVKLFGRRRHGFITMRRAGMVTIKFQSESPTLNESLESSLVYLLLMTPLTALPNKGLYELTRRPAETIEEPGCSQVKMLKFDQI